MIADGHAYGFEAIDDRLLHHPQRGAVIGSGGGIAAMVDTAHYQVRIPGLVLVLQAEFYAGGRRSVQIGPVTRSFLRKILVRQLFHPQRNRDGRGTLVILGSDHRHIPETGHDAG